MTAKTTTATCSGPDVAEVKARILSDMAEMWHVARAAGFENELKAHHRPMPLIAVGAAIVDWCVLLTSMWLVEAIGLIGLPAAILIIGNRQRALGNLLHDAAHWSFDYNKRRGDLIADWLICLPMFTSMAVYRSEHFDHHRLLGDGHCDVDLIHDDEDLTKGWLRLWLKHTISWKMWVGSLCGNVVRGSRGDRVRVLCWWVGFVSAICAVIDGASAVMCVVLWLLSRATSFHAITVFREISDHVGLRPGTLIGFTRNHCSRGVLRFVFHPHHNGYHLVHHLNPGVPFYFLPSAHRLLLNWDKYAVAEHCESYFLGGKSAIRSWVRTTKK